MLKMMSALAATGLAVLGVSSLAGAAGKSTTRTNALTVVAVLGPRVNVPAGTGSQAHFVKAFATCPRGYYVTGGGAYSGAITEIASGPTADLRGWFVDGTNNDPKGRTFQHAADAVCVKGSSAVTIGPPAPKKSQLRHAERDFAAGLTPRR